MKAEIIAVGSELLLGDVINSNAAWISKELAAMGIDVFYHVTVGDNPTRIQAVVDKALERSDILIFTGGLGPTDDDLTVATLAGYFKISLVNDPASEETIRNYFVARGMAMSPTNVKQALRPEDAMVIPNPIGTAPGIFWDVSDKAGKSAFILSFPGVPKELYAMWPFGMDCLKQRLSGSEEGSLGNSGVLVTMFMRFFGIGESKLGEMLSDLMAAKNPTVAPYVGKVDVRIRLSAKAASPQEAYRLIQPVKQEILSRCSAHYYGDDETTLEQAVASVLMEKQKTLSVAESCTGGLLSSRLTDVPGSSAYTLLNAVTYSNAQKEALLGVSPETLMRFGAVSPETASEMARGMLKRADTDLALSITGVAGPDGGTEEKPVGLAYIGIIEQGMPEPLVKEVMVNPNYGRTDIKLWFTQYALFYLREFMAGRLVSDEIADVKTC